MKSLAKYGLALPWTVNIKAVGRCGIIVDSAIIIFTVAVIMKRGFRKRYAFKR